jgi:hypothetical protein
MRTNGRGRVWAAFLCASLWVVTEAVAAQSNPATPQITVYESPT